MHFDNCGSLCAPVLGLLVSLGLVVLSLFELPFISAKRNKNYRNYGDLQEFLSL